MNDSTSSLHTESDRGINNLIMSSVLLSIAKTRLDIHKLLSKTLLKIQEHKLKINVKEIVDKAISQLLKNGVLRIKQENPTKTSSIFDETFFFPSQINNENDTSQSIMSPNSEKKRNKKKRILLVNSTELELSPLGRAAMKGKFV